jgi:hypothetical protein
MCCQTCFKSLTETSFDDVFKDLTRSAGLTAKQLDEFGQKISQDVGQSFQQYQEDLARRTIQAPDSPLSPYQANQDLTLDELVQATQTLRAGSVHGIAPRAQTDSLRGPSPDAVFHDDLP